MPLEHTAAAERVIPSGAACVGTGKSAGTRQTRRLGGREEEEEESGDFPVQQVMERPSGSLCPADACTGTRACYYTFSLFFGGVPGGDGELVLKLIHR